MDVDVPSDEQVLEESNSNSCSNSSSSSSSSSSNNGEPLASSSSGGVTKAGRLGAIDPWGHPLKRGFVLPDFDTLHRGYVKPWGESPKENEQILYMESERFCVPEVLFQPQIVGLNHAGIGEAFGQSIDTLSHPVCDCLTALLSLDLAFYY